MFFLNIFVLPSFFLKNEVKNSSILPPALGEAASQGHRRGRAGRMKVGRRRKGRRRRRKGRRRSIGWRRATKERRRRGEG